MTPKSPEEQAAELYPIPANFNKPYTQWDITNAQRAAWLSRQAEVDELKRQEELKAQRVYQALQLSRDNYAKLSEQNVMLVAKLAAKEKEHDAEMCAFAEWVSERWRQDDDTRVYYPIELLKQYRNDK
jgi:hypothetical protein